MASLLFLVTSCSGHAPEDGEGLLHPSLETDPCATPNAGCACDRPGQVIDCGEVLEHEGDFVSCDVGQRTCGEDRTWSACSGGKVTRVPLLSDDRLKVQSLGASQKCETNPCDPYCHSFTDTGDGVIAPGFISGTGTGLEIERLEVTETEDPCLDLVLAPESTTVVVTDLGGAAAATGLLGEYFNQQSGSITQVPNTWTVTGSRTDAVIDFAFGNGSPGVTGIGSDNFTIRWTGTLNIATGGSYKFATYSDDGMRLWINGTLVINRWVPQSPTWVESSAVNLTAGSSYDIRVEYYEAGGGATAQLNWQHPSAGWQVIPASAYSPPGASAGEFTTIPESVDFSANLLPASCYEGGVEPLFSLDRFDSSYISPDGEFRVYAPIAGELDVTAYLGPFIRTARADVIVDAVETSAAPSGAVNNHDKVPSGTDPATFLYPYANTVFPLALAPPVIQYATGGTSAASVKYTLRWPATGDPMFEWSRIVAEPSNQRLAIPEYAWNALEKTAKGDDALLVIQRVVGTTPRNEITRPIRFATAPLRGKIYYTQYGRNGSTKMMVADPTTGNPAADAFSGGSDGCPVCHTVSAQGNVFATTYRSFSSQGGLSDILSTGYLSPTYDHPGGSTYSSGSNDYRGFAWAPLTPDGVYALQANNIYGNTIQQVVGIDTTNDTVSVPSTFTSGGDGTGLLAEFYTGTSYTGTKWKRYVPHIDYAYGSSTAVGGPISNTFSSIFSGQIMAYKSETYTFQINTRDGVVLTVGGTTVINNPNNNSSSVISMTGTVPMVEGQKVDIELRWRDTSGAAALEMHWSSPSTPFGLVPTEMLYPDDGLHGVEARFYNSNNHTNLHHTSLEPNIAHDWGTGSQLGLPTDNHSTEWRTRLEAPITGNVQICARSDENTRVAWNGTNIINLTGVVDSCSSNQAVIAGNFYDVLVTHRDTGSNSRIELSWQSGSWTREVIAGPYLYPPTGFSVPASGLKATYYDGDMWTSGRGENPTPGAFSTYVSTINDNWGNGRPNYSVLSDSETFGARYVGSINLPCSGIYEFRSVADDGSALYIGQNRLTRLATNGTSDGAAYFSTGVYDFKYQMQESTGGASANLQWIPRCLGVTSFTTIPTGYLLPTGGTASAGLVRSGGDNGNNSGYFVWQTNVEAGTAPVDVTSDTRGRWGLGLTAMMVPSFAPDGSKLVFVDGDSSGGAGWRKGLSVFDFDQTEKLFSNRRNILSTWPSGNVVKWPVFESDSRTVLYNETTPVDWCCKGGWTQYGHMAPTNYFEIPGLLYSIDSEAATPEPTELKILNEGERAADANKAYQATVLPTAVAGYRWVVFTSTRPYGNTFNTTSNNNYSNPASFTPMVNNTNLQSMLWISALDDEVSGSADRSHPPFLLPNQNYSESASNGFLNERGFWALDACRPIGVGAGSECEVDEDCCGGNGADKTAVCSLDIPVSFPPTRHCRSAPSVTACTPRGETCTDAGECCLNDVCVNAACTAPPTLASLSPTNFTRDYEAACPNGEQPLWRYFDWKAETPGDSYIEFYAQSVGDPAEFEALPLAPDPVDSTRVIGVGLVAGPTLPGWVGNNVGSLLNAAGLPQRQHLRITMRFVPSADNEYTPTLTDWRLSYSCLPDE